MCGCPKAEIYTKERKHMLKEKQLEEQNYGIIKCKNSFSIV